MNSRLDALQERVGDMLAVEFGETEEDRLFLLLSDERIRELIDWRIPLVSDVSGLLAVTRGSVQSVRMDKLGEASNLKKPIVAGLIVLLAAGGRFARRGIRWLTDAGNMNTGYALRYYCRRFGLGAHYIMSRYFPDDVVALLREDGVIIEKAPPRVGVGIEREFYSHLFDRMRQAEFRRDKVCLWHAKNGGKVARVMARMLVDRLTSPPTLMVVSLGSGASLQMMIEVRRLVNQSATIIVVEHEDSPLLAGNGLRWLGADEIDLRWNYDIAECRARLRSSGSTRIPHCVIGPHYEEVNPFLSDEDLREVNLVQLYSERQWPVWSSYLHEVGLDVGNSSAVHLMIAAHFANQGHNVLTMIAEPQRSYYLSDKEGRCGNKCEAGAVETVGSRQCE